MNYIYITGTSRGIGKAIAEKLLEDSNNHIIGIGRSCTIKHQRYEHITMDVSDLSKVKGFDFRSHYEAAKIVLINNSGILGEVDLVGNLDSDRFIECFNVNVISAGILMNKFIGKYKESMAQKQILNISSGAARHPIE
jgi:benzil reductase ((S)-benzoin forming)